MIILVKKVFTHLPRQDIIIEVEEQGIDHSLEFLFNLLRVTKDQEGLIQSILLHSPIDERKLLKDFRIIGVMPDRQRYGFHQRIEPLKDVGNGLAALVEQIPYLLCVIFTHINLLKIK